MRVVQVKIAGFRGVRAAEFTLDPATFLIGASNAGKSTVIEALALALGRDRMYQRQLTEHDFYGSDPQPADRVRITVTLAGFSGQDAHEHRDWFSDRAGIEKWWYGDAVHDLPPDSGAELCVQIAFCARFDHEDLEVEYRRYFCDEDGPDDPFEQDDLRRIPRSLLQEVGFYFVPAQRTWDRTLSFNSELFRRVIRSIAHLPADRLLDQRDALRHPEKPIEDVEGLRELIGRLNGNLTELLPGEPALHLRVTDTDSDALLRALVPHFTSDGPPALPVRRHGTGLLSLQTLLLLLELGRERKEAGKSFILALEEPELHLPLGAQRSIVHKLLGCTSQLLVTTHSPAIASLPAPETIRVLTNTGGNARAPQLTEPLGGDTPNALRRLMRDFRQELLDALMHPHVLIPEGRIDFEWLMLLQRIVTTAGGDTTGAALRFGAEIGVVKTHDSAIVETHAALAKVRANLLPVVDGDQQGRRYVSHLARATKPPRRVLRWARDSCIEDVLGWILRADEAAVLGAAADLEHFREVSSVDALVRLLKSSDRAAGGLKGNYLAYDDLAALITGLPACVTRATTLLTDINQVATADDPGSKRLTRSDEPSTEDTAVYTWKP